MRCNWRGCQEWIRQGLPLSTSSDEAARLYDAALTQYVGFYDDEALGGLTSTIQRLYEADPDFVMADVLNYGLKLNGLGKSVMNDADLRSNLESLDEKAKRQMLTEREKLHVQAIQLLGKGSCKAACDVWNEILLDDPTDVLALRFAHGSYIYLGLPVQMRDSVARVIPWWNSSDPLYGYVLGMHAFGLCESMLYEKAEEYAKKALQLNCCDGWSIHALMHIYDAQGRNDEGIDFLEKTFNDWQSTSRLSCHLSFHWALFLIENGAYQETLDIWDRHIGGRAKLTKAIFHLIDSCSVLYRLELEGVDVGDRWKGLYSLTRLHVGSRVGLNVSHFIMALLRSGHKEEAEEYLRSIGPQQQLDQDRSSSRDSFTQGTVSALCKAIMAYENEDYSAAADLIWPIRYNIISVGGSEAQRDLFTQILIHAAIKSTNQRHHKVARHVVAEKKALKENSPLLERLMQRVLTMND